MRERLQKILSRAGVTSRRRAEDLIREGRVCVNGRIVRELGSQADPDVDSIRVDDRAIRAAGPTRVIALYKPKEVVTTLHDPEGRATVAEFLPRGSARLFPIGRLDYHSEGLLLLTNDGEIAQQVMHPSSELPKVYHAKVRGVPSPAVLQRFARGFHLDGRRTRPAKVARLRRTEEGNTWVEVRIHEGRRNQIRRMFQYLGHSVQKLRRVSVGPIELGALAPGRSRELDPREVDGLRRACRAGDRRPTVRRGAR